MALVVSTVAIGALPMSRVSPPDGGYSVLPPRGWKFQDASYPSDHATHLGFDPRGALPKMMVTVSGCAGTCIQQNGVPKPERAVPPGTVNTYRISAYEVALIAYSSDDPYPDEGVVIVTHDRRGISGFLRVELWLPHTHTHWPPRSSTAFRICGCGARLCH